MLKLLSIIKHGIINGLVEKLGYRMWGMGVGCGVAEKPLNPYKTLLKTSNSVI